MVKQADWVRIADGSFGSRNGQPWSRELAQANGRSQPSDTAAGIHGAVVAPSQDALLAAIEAQTCPWCGRGPFKVLALHTNREHGIGRVELREMAGLSQSDSICAPEVASRARENLTTRDDWEDMRKRGNAKSTEVGAGVHGSAIRVKRLREENKDRDAGVLAAVRAGELREDIAARFNITRPTITRILKLNCVDDDGRKRAAQARRSDSEWQARMREASSKALEAERQSRLARFAELGSTWEALDAMASKEGRTRRSMAGILRTAGAQVPDGRTSTTHRRDPATYVTRPKKPCAADGCSRDSRSKGLCENHYRKMRSKAGK